MAEWMSAHDARLFDLGSNPPGQEIVKWAKAGKIEARAELLDGAVSDDESGFFRLTTDFWEGVLQRTGSAYRDWANGSFKASMGGALRDRARERVADGVQFRADQIRGRFVRTSTDSYAAPPIVVSPPQKHVGGAPRDSEKWNAVTVAIARLANEGRLDRSLPTRFTSQAAMRSAILDDADVAILGVADETIKPLVRKVWNALLG